MAIQRLQTYHNDNANLKFVTIKINYNWAIWVQFCIVIKILCVSCGIVLPPLAWIVVSSDCGWRKLVSAIVLFRCVFGRISDRRLVCLSPAAKTEKSKQETREKKKRGGREENQGDNDDAMKSWWRGSAALEVRWCLALVFNIVSRESYPGQLKASSFHYIALKAATKESIISARLINSIFLLWFVRYETH